MTGWRKILRVSILVLAAILVSCLVWWFLWLHPDWFGGDSIYKPLSDCPLPAPTVPADSGWSAVAPDSSWEGWDPASLEQSLDAVAVDSKGQVYVAGGFTQIGGLKTGGIARWNPEAKQWADLEGGLLSRGEYMNHLRLLADGQDRVYVSGSFSSAGGRIANGIALWDGQAWSELQGGLMDGEVNGMALDGRGGVYVAGSFTRVGSLQSPGIAHWNGQSWEDPGGLAERLVEMVNDQLITVSAIAYDPARRTLYASIAYDPSANHYSIVAWQEDHSSWSILMRTDFAQAMQLALGPSGDLYAAGAGKFDPGSEGVARYAQGQWSGLRGGLTRMGGSKRELAYHGATNLPSIYNSSLAVDPAGRVYLGGHFTAVDDRCMYGVALWDGANWRALGSGVPADIVQVPSLVRSLALDPHGALYIAGRFQSAGGKPIRYLARWIP